MDTKGKAAARGKGSGSEKGIRHTHYPAESARSQCARLLRYLREHGRIDTREARRQLDIMSPAARVYDLRYKVGVDITSVIHPESRVATYVLRSGGADHA